MVRSHKPVIKSIQMQNHLKSESQDIIQTKLKLQILQIQPPSSPVSSLWKDVEDVAS